MGVRLVLKFFQSFCCSIEWRFCWIYGTRSVYSSPVWSLITVDGRTALLLGILYLAFQAFPIIFEQVHGFDMQMTGLTFLGIGIGQVSFSTHASHTAHSTPLPRSSPS